MTSCIQDIGEIGCQDTTDSVFDAQDSVWMPTEIDTIIYKSNKGNDIVWSLYDYQSKNFIDSGCKRPLGTSTDYSCSRKIDRIVISMARYDKVEKIVSNIGYAFSQLTDNLIPITQQVMGLIDVKTNQPINTNSNQYVQTTKLGTHELNGKTYNDVFVIEDLSESNVPQIDIFRFYVNPSGILRIEFYDGEVWDRVD
ncbi:hypothetical protein Fleli_3172 [Bernardetia litoralis DSM 6794]|uniref:Uncharacterized protein n=1 Tax=Bernardetia litoralis (strain ATCC 23117 / DSM 6794 / NBRC 15988 / NCIMB 1366 / Fx l1 / Sio-4) TaxID=880071 RepID=I4ANG9_BERLS|nr:hypothetical protein [Bernardetia litoralis]AFM05504.1 hypothetical protein Fleli_3172 [Bernardetia litoralis DSM 6794]